MRAKGEARGDGPPAGIRIPVADGRDWSTQARGNGSRLRGRYARRDQSAVLASYEGHSYVVLSRSRGARDSAIN